MNNVEIDLPEGGSKRATGYNRLVSSSFLPSTHFVYERTLAHPLKYTQTHTHQHMPRLHCAILCA